MNANKIFQQMSERKFAEALRLVNTGVDINGFYFDRSGTFLYRAISESNYELVKFLLEHGANPNSLFYGNNALYFLHFQSRRDVLILEELLRAGAWLLPMNYQQQTLLEQLEETEYRIEDDLQQMEGEYDTFLETNNRDEEKDDEFQSQLRILNRELTIARDMIVLARPIAEANVVKLKLEVSGTPMVIDITIDRRASVATLGSIVNYFYFEDSLVFDLVYPAFHLQDKRVMEGDRALSDYGVRTGTKLSIISRITSERHWNAEGGKRNRRVKKTHKKKRGYLSGKTRRH